MRRTLNEVYRICQKAAEGAGVPTGLDIDGAHNTVWLAAHGFAALDTLAGELQRAGGEDAYCFDAADIMRETLDVSDKAGALLAPALVDLLIARVEGETGQLAATGLSAPLYLLAAAVPHTRAGWCFSFEIRNPHDQRFVLNADPGGASILGPLGTDVATLDGDSGFDVTGRCGRVPDHLAVETTELGVLVGRDTLARSETLNRGSGTDVEPRTWDQLQHFAARVLVPATAESRLRGAGSETNDNE
jgi:hypothetical protein